MRQPSPAQISALARASADAQGLPLPEAYVPGVEANLAVAFRLSASFLDLDLGAMAEPAPGFTALPPSFDEKTP